LRGAAKLDHIRPPALIVSRSAVVPLAAIRLPERALDVEHGLISRFVGGSASVEESGSTDGVSAEELAGPDGSASGVGHYEDVASDLAQFIPLRVERHACGFCHG
jgi:hypothetical protein